MQILLYTTHCPKCIVLEKKLKEKKIQYEERTDIDEMIKLRFTSVPCLMVDNKLLSFSEAMSWVKEQ